MVWSVGSTALGRGLQITPGRPGYGLPSFHLVSSLEGRCQKSLCDGSQKLVFSRGAYQISTDTTMFARIRGRMTKTFTRWSNARWSLRQHEGQCSFGADWRVCVACLFPEDVDLEGRIR